MWPTVRSTSSISCLLPLGQFFTEMFQLFGLHVVTTAALVGHNRGLLARRRHLIHVDIINICIVSGIDRIGYCYFGGDFFGRHFFAGGFFAGDLFSGRCRRFFTRSFAGCYFRSCFLACRFFLGSRFFPSGGLGSARFFCQRLFCRLLFSCWTSDLRFLSRQLSPQRFFWRLIFSSRLRHRRRPCLRSSWTWLMLCQHCLQFSWR